VTLDGFVNKVAKQPVWRTGVNRAMFHHRLRIETPRVFKGDYHSKIAPKTLLGG